MQFLESNVLFLFRLRNSFAISSNLSAHIFDVLDYLLCDDFVWNNMNWNNWIRKNWIRYDNLWSDMMDHGSDGCLDTFWLAEIKSILDTVLIDFSHLRTQKRSNMIITRILGWPIFTSSNSMAIAHNGSHLIMAQSFNIKSHLYFKFKQ